MTALSLGALIMAVFGFVVLFGGLAVTLHIALSGGFGYESDEEEQDEDPAGPA
ncbi:MAG: hypothetical protein ACI8VE_002071 [Natrialbaceae archaeon]|jgi:hypothetical protein